MFFLCGLAPDQILNRHFLAVTRDSVDRPKSANPRLYGQGKEGRNHHGGKGRPASAEVGVRSVFTIEIDGSRGNPSSRSIQTVPIGKGFSFLMILFEYYNIKSFGKFLTLAVPSIDRNALTSFSRHLRGNPMINQWKTHSIVCWRTFLFLFQAAE